MIASVRFVNKLKHAKCVNLHTFYLTLNVYSNVLMVSFQIQFNAYHVLHSVHSVNKIFNVYNAKMDGSQSTESVSNNNAKYKEVG